MLRVLFFAVLASLSFVGSAALAQKCQTDKVRIDGLTHYHTPYPITGAAPGYQHDKYGTEPREIVREFAAYFASFDAGHLDFDSDGKPDILAQPRFVAYEIKAGEINPDTAEFEKPATWDRPDNWYTEATHALDFARQQDGVRKPRIDDSYNGVGRTWNRGHMAMKLHAERVGHEAACNTHFFWNAVPQAASLNQGPWLDLEYWTGAAANKFGSVWIIAGPIFDQGHVLEWIGDPGEVPVAIPDAIFKIVIRDEGVDSPPTVLAFVYPNRPNFKKCSTTPVARAFGAFDHAQFLTSVGEVETRTGLTFFGNLPADQRQSILHSQADSLWEVEPRFIAISCKP